MFIYKNKKTGKIVKLPEKDEKKEHSKEWELVNEFRNSFIDTSKVVQKGRHKNPKKDYGKENN